MHAIPSRLLLFAALATVSALHAQNSPLQSPSAAQLNRIRAEEKIWVLRDGARLQPSVFYFTAPPALVLRIPEAQPAHEADLDALAIVTALEFLLADDAFDQIQVTLVEFNPRRLAEQTERSVVVTRQQFKAQAIGAGKAAAIGSAVNNLRGDRASLARLRSLLGLR